MLQMLQDGQPGFGLRVHGDKCPPSDVTVDFGGLGVAMMRYQIDGAADVIYTLEVRDDGSLTQSASISSTTDTTLSLKYDLNLGISVHRASYGQLTEGGPIPLPASENHLQLHDATHLTITNKHLDAHLQGWLAVNGRLVKVEELEETTRIGAPLDSSFSRTLTLAPKSTTTVTAEFKLVPFMSNGLSPQPQPSSGILGTAAKAPQWCHPERVETFIIRRNLDYILGNCALTVSEGCVAIITDHVALPLGWNRDN
jgi:hypothetical protein